MTDDGAGVGPSRLCAEIALRRSAERDFRAGSPTSCAASTPGVAVHWVADHAEQGVRVPRRARPVLARLTCPVLAFYGETDEWMPIEESEAAWQAAQGRGGPRDLTLVRLPRADHLPTEAGRPEIESMSALYTETLTHWLASRSRRWDVEPRRG